MNPTVILSNGIDAQLRQTVEKACINEGLRCINWTSSQVLSPNDQHSVLLVGELQSGSRNLPDSLSALATSQFPQALMMLFCREALARNSKTIHHGRLTLVGPPPDLETVIAALRTAFGTSRALSSTKFGNTNGIRQLRGRRWWAGAVAQADGAQNPERIRVPYMDGEPEKGVGFWLPEANASIDNAHIETGLDLLGSESTDTRFGRNGHAPLAAMSLNLSENRWRVFLTDPHVSCWLLSYKRFPHAWHLSASESVNSVQRVNAAGGDIMALWYDPNNTLKSGADEIDPELLLAAECGGHALLDLLNSQSSKTETLFSAIVAEVRQ